MNDTIKTQRFIPFSLHDIQRICRNTKIVEPQAFEQHLELFSKLINLEYQQQLDQLKLSYAPHNPDLDTKLWQPEQTNDQHLTEQVKQVLISANYEQLTEQDLIHAMDENSLCKLKLDVNFSEFKQLLVFTRGEHLTKHVVKRLGRFGRKTIEFANYERVFIFLQFKDKQWYADNKKTPDQQLKPGAIMLKLFKDVPKADLETLFPNTKIKMRNLDKLLIGVPALASGGIILATKLGATMLLLGAVFSFYFGWSKEPVVLDQKNLLILAAGLATLGGYLWKQFSAFKTKKIQFMQTLSSSLYYKALDNNVGVFHYLIDSAKESETKELLLAWTFMHQLKRASAEELDSVIEQFFATELDTELDFDVADALAKLVRFELVTQEGQHYTIKALSDSKQLLIAKWQHIALRLM